MKYAAVLLMLGLGVGQASAQAFQYYAAGDRQLLILAEGKVFELNRTDGPWSPVQNAEKGFEAWRRRHYDGQTSDTFAQGVLAGKFVGGKARAARVTIRVARDADGTMHWTWAKGPADGVEFRAESQDSVPRWALSEPSREAFRALAAASSASDEKNLLAAAGSPKFKPMLAAIADGNRYAIALGKDLSVTEFVPAPKPMPKSDSDPDAAAQGKDLRSRESDRTAAIIGALVVGLLIGGFASFAGRLAYNRIATQLKREPIETYARVSERDRHVLAFLRNQGGYPLVEAARRPQESIQETLARLLRGVPVPGGVGRPGFGTDPLAPDPSAPYPIAGGTGTVGTGTATDPVIVERIVPRPEDAARIRELELREKQLIETRDAERRDNVKLRESLLAEQGRVNAMSLERTQLADRLEALAIRIESLQSNVAVDHPDAEAGGTRGR
ncbi:MAG: hypothetical protein SFX74_09730 [Fimbriimonadaceae bacterium]|nr:hypothetical protein [Fimbriimonadaceae bacterium]